MSSVGFRHAIRPQGTGFVVACEPPREWSGIVFLSLWLFAWSVGGLAAMSSALRPGGLDAFLVFWLLAWFVATVAVAGTIVWQLVGREELAFTASHLTHRWRAAGVGRTKVYALERVRHFRETEYIAPSMKTQYALVPPGVWTPHGVLGFDYEGETVRAGAALRPEDARRIVAEVAKRLPRLVAN
jgi:hypothetical protein